MTEERKQELDKIAIEWVVTSMCLHLIWNALDKLPEQNISERSEEDNYLIESKTAFIHYVLKSFGFIEEPEDTENKISMSFKYYE